MFGKTMADKKRKKDENPNYTDHQSLVSARCGTVGRVLHLVLETDETRRIYQSNGPKPTNQTPASLSCSLMSFRVFSVQTLRSFGTWILPGLNLDLDLDLDLVGGLCACVHPGKQTVQNLKSWFLLVN